MKKGFTLMELLAVIVILAIIALIATPIILGIIENAKEESDERSVELYAESIEQSIAKDLLIGKQVSDGIYEINEDGDMCLATEDISLYCIDIKISGEKPTVGRVTVTNGTITKIEVTKNGKDFIIDSTGKMELAAELEPGLYDNDNKLIVTWDELVKEIDKSIQVDNTYDNSFGQEIESKYSNGAILIIGRLDKDGNVITNIGHHAFYRCDTLISVTIPDSVTTIENHAFANNSLTRVTIGNGVTSIGDYAFAESSLIRVIIGNSVTSIGKAAFYNCMSLKSITFPDSVTSIGDLAFYNCRNFKNITIPASVRSIGKGVFGRCNRIASVKVAENNPIYDSRDNSNAIIEKSTNKLVVGCKKTIIPDSVTSIDDYAFIDSGLSSITIPTSVTSIGERAFESNYSLSSITIPTSVTSIGKDAFLNCALSTVYFEHTNDHNLEMDGNSFAGGSEKTFYFKSQKLQNKFNDVLEGNKVLLDK